MRVTLHLDAQNPMLPSMAARPWPPKPARDIAAEVTGQLPTGSGRFPPRRAAPRSRRRVTAVVSPALNPAPRRAAGRSQAASTAPSALHRPRVAPSCWLGTALVATSPPLGTSPAPWPDVLVLGDSDEAGGTPRSTSAVSLPRVDRERTNFRTRYSVDCGPSCWAASLDGHAEACPQLHPGPAYAAAAITRSPSTQWISSQTAAGGIR